MAAGPRPGSGIPFREWDGPAGGARAQTRGAYHGPTSGCRSATRACRPAISSFE